MNMEFADTIFTNRLQSFPQVAGINYAVTLTHDCRTFVVVCEGTTTKAV